MDSMVQRRIEGLLARTSSSNEHEAAQAMEMLQALLLRHNLDLADLEMRGQRAPSLQEKGHDLGKAAFRWKLDLAEAIADHYFCHPLVDRKAKTVKFVGRPDNVESLTALYRWVIEQIKMISRNERRVHILQTGEHIDPLRWQVNFGLGVVDRLGKRLNEIRQKRAEDNQVSALVVHHQAEISDWLEEKHGYRVDGQMTKVERERRERNQARIQFKKEMTEAGTLEEYYRRYPWDRPSTPEQIAEYERHLQESIRREERNARRRTGQITRYREVSEDEYRRSEQAEQARSRGHESADRVNLEPFLQSGDNPGRLER